MRTICVLLACTLAHAAASLAAPVDPAFPTFGGYFGNTTACFASAISGDTLFLGGQLRWVGPLTGGGVPVGASDLAPLAGFPRVNGIVRCAAPDGAGGWYVGGLFTHVGGAVHANLAHVLADLSVDSWAPSTGGIVTAMAVSPANVYIAGSLGNVNGTTVTAFAGVSRSTGAVVFAGFPSAAPNAAIQALATDGTTLFVGGNFTSFGAAPRGYLASVTLSNHSLTFWSPNASAPIYALRCANGLVYAGGGFTIVQGVARSRAAALNPATGAPTAWNPNVTGSGRGVLAILPAGDRIYLGGEFDHVGGAARTCAAAVDTASGVVQPWDPQLSAAATVWSLELAGSAVVAGGVFESVGGLARSDLARLDPISAAPDPSTPETPAETRALAASGAKLFVGGAFSGYGSSRRGDLAAVRISTGEPLPWAPDATHDAPYLSHVLAVAVDDTRVYTLISFFDPFGGTDRQAVRAFSRATGAADWNLEPYGVANALARVDSRLIVGGDFFPPSPQGGLLACDAATGAGVAWGGTTSGGPVLALAPTPAGLVVGGTFTSAGGQPRTGLAMLDPVSGLATAWDPGPNGAVRAFALAGSTLFCGGDFSTVGGQPRSRLVALALETGVPEAWNPGANATVRALTFQQGTLFAGGGFTSVGGQPRTSLAAVNPADGTTLPWDAAIAPGGTVYALGAGAGRVLAGGSQTSTGVEPTAGLSAVMGPDPLLGVPTGGGATRLALRVEPQPLRSTALIRFRLPKPSDVEIAVYDPAGRRLLLVEPRRHREAGEQSIRLERGGLRPGLYVVRLTTADGRAAVKTIVLP